MNNNVAKKKLLDFLERGHTQVAVVMTGLGGTCTVSEMGRVTWLDKALERKIIGPVSEADAPKEKIMFDFEMKYVRRPRDRYYLTRWDLAVPITIRAATEQDAINTVAAALVDLGRKHYYTFYTIRVTSAVINDEKTPNA